MKVPKGWVRMGPGWYKTYLGGKVISWLYSGQDGVPKNGWYTLTSRGFRPKGPYISCTAAFKSLGVLPPPKCRIIEKGKSS